MKQGKPAPNVPIVTSFLRYNVSAGLATATDYSVLLLLKEIFGIYYVTATFFGAVCGATVAFFLGRNWTFFNKEGKISSQGMKFFFVVCGSIILNTFGEYFYTDIIQVGHYMLARVITSITVGLAYNFPMQRYFVFR